jgi:AcrR family transcriptional regulator
MKGESRGKRAYRKRLRADREGETRRRILAASVSLHEEIGPLRTSIAKIARRAGVERATVYRHFPDDTSLFRACQAHWLEDYPFPLVQAWREFADPEERVRRAVDEMYAYYERGQPMLENIFRDAPRIPALADVLIANVMADAAANLADGFDPPAERRDLAVAAAALALSFDTWRTLVAVIRLAQPKAVELMTAFVVDTARR